MKGQKGVTLIELLAVLSISTIVIIIVFSIYSSAMKVNQLSIENVDLRNEAVLICNQMDRAMLNINTIKTNGEIDSDGNFVSFNATDNRMEYDSSLDKYIEVNYANTLVEINKEDLLIDNQPINSDSYSVEGSSFSLANGGLMVKLIITDPVNGLSMEVNKFYSLQSE